MNYISLKNRKLICQIKSNNLFFFYIIYSLLIIPIRLYNQFSAFYSLSGDIILLTNEGIQLYNTNFKNSSKVSVPLTSTNIFSSEDERKKISFTNFPTSDNGNFSICCLGQKAYILKDDKYQVNIDIKDFEQNYKILIPYQFEGTSMKFIFGAIKLDRTIDYSYIYLRLYNSNYLEFEKIINYQEETGENVEINENAITCQFMYFNNSNNNNIICFFQLVTTETIVYKGGYEEEENEYEDEIEYFHLSANVINIENNFKIIDYLINENKSEKIGAIKSITSEDKKRCLICYNNYNGIDQYKTKCIIYNSEENKWENEFKLYDYCSNKNYFMDFMYINNTQEYVFYCFYGRLTVSVFYFDNDFNLRIIYNNSANRTFTLGLKTTYHIYTSSFVFLPNNNKFMLLYRYTQDHIFNYLNSIELCLNEISMYDCSKTFENNTSFNNSDTINILSDSSLSNTSNLMDDLNTINSDTINGKLENIDFLDNSEIISNNAILNNNTLINSFQKINFVTIDNINMAELDITKNEMVNNIENIMNQVEIGKNYKIEGEDYDIVISPINTYKSMNITYVDLGECCNILRSKYNLSSEEVISILQIEIHSYNEKVLSNKVEYLLYDEKRNQLDLSFCEDIPIAIDYKIKNTSLINTSLISYYSNLNIDIYNHNDSFFNDICYSFSEANSSTDLVLEDREADIYQNYSLCEENCVYIKIDIETMRVKCQCHVKQKVIIDEKPPIFFKIIKNSFVDSNFGVIKCFHQVFSFDNKFKNCGFWVSLVIFGLHIPLFIIFFIYRLKSVKDFIYKEMEKNNYINKVNQHHPPKIKFKNYESGELSKSSVKNENDEIMKTNRIYSDVNSSEKLKIKTKKNNNNKNNKKMNSIKNHLSNKFDDQRTNDILQLSEKKDELMNYKKNEKNLYKVKTFYMNNNPKDKNEERKAKARNSCKKVKFNISKEYKTLFKKMDSKDPIHKPSKIRKSKSKIYRTRHSNKNNYESFEIFKKILGNEEKKKFPGFYNLIHVNANNNPTNRPLDSKFILDNFEFESAVKYDKRSFFRIYFICLLSKENILNTFCFKSPLEVPAIRLCLFLFNYSCDFALNAFFYLNQKISDRYHYRGENLFIYSIVNNMTVSITSTLCSFLLFNLLSLLTNSKDEIVSIFRKEEEKMRNDKNFKITLNIKNKIIKELNKIFRMLIFKIILFIIIESLILFFFFYYMVAFCSVYKKTQYSWLADCGISFLLTIPFELVSSLLITVFYNISLTYKLKFIYSIVMFFYSLG